MRPRWSSLTLRARGWCARFVRAPGRRAPVSRGARSSYREATRWRRALSLRNSWVRCICGGIGGSGAVAVRLCSAVAVAGRRRRDRARFDHVCAWCAGGVVSRSPGEAGLPCSSAEAAGGVKMRPTGPSAASCAAVLFDADGRPELAVRDRSRGGSRLLLASERNSAASGVPAVAVPLPMRRRIVAAQLLLSRDAEARWAPAGLRVW
jgi:hypothetical protein